MKRLLANHNALIALGTAAVALLALIVIVPMYTDAQSGGGLTRNGTSSKFKVGTRVEVTTSSQIINEAGDTTGKRSTTRGERATIIGGPKRKAVSNSNFWQVRFDKDNLAGWVVEIYIEDIANIQTANALTRNSNSTTFTNGETVEINAVSNVLNENGSVKDRVATRGEKATVIGGPKRTATGITDFWQIRFQKDNIPGWYSAANLKKVSGGSTTGGGTTTGGSGTFQLVATPSTIAVGESTRLAWDARSLSSSASCATTDDYPNWTGTLPNNGNRTLSPNQTRTFRITCVGGGQSVTKTATVNVTGTTGGSVGDALTRNGSSNAYSSGDKVVTTSPEWIINEDGTRKRNANGGENATVISNSSKRKASGEENYWQLRFDSNGEAGWYPETKLKKAGSTTQTGASGPLTRPGSSSTFKVGDRVRLKDPQQVVNEAGVLKRIAARGELASVIANNTRRPAQDVTEFWQIRFDVNHEAGWISQEVLEKVAIADDPTGKLSFTASKYTIASREAVVLQWNAQGNNVNCSPSPNDNFGSWHADPDAPLSVPSGRRTVNPPESRVYTIYCTIDNTSYSKSVRIEVQGQQNTGGSQGGTKISDELANISEPIVDLSNRNWCHVFTTHVFTNTSFAPPYDPANRNELLIKANCNDNGSVTVNFGNENKSVFVWMDGYAWDAANTQWKPISFRNVPGTGTVYPIKSSTNELLGKYSDGIVAATFEIGNVSGFRNLADNANFVVAYYCAYNNSKWRCGCTDTNCANGNRWSLQRLSNSGPQTQP